MAQLQLLPTDVERQQEPFHPGLEGIIAGETAISSIDDGLRYRGYSVAELARHCSFEEVAYLLLYGELPDRQQLTAFHDRVAQARPLPEAVQVLLRSLPPATNQMDALRSAVSVLSHFDPDVQRDDREANLRKAERMLGQIPGAIAYRFRAARGLPPVRPRLDLTQAAHFLYLLHGQEPNPAVARALDASLILYAEHEFNASTFTARVACSTESDLYSAVVAAIGALKGRLHGGANEEVMKALRAAGGPDTAEAWVLDALARKERIMGFGHRVYKKGDVRAVILKHFLQPAAEAAGQTHWEATAEVIERVLQREKGLLPNLDWPAGRLYHALGLEVPLYTPIFVMARVAGWSAHVMEQLAHNRLIRPRSRYIGPKPRSIGGR